MQSHTRSWALPAVLALVTAATGCQSTNTGPTDIKPVAILRQFEGNDPGLREADIVVINSQQELNALGSQRLGDTPVDFNRESLIVFSLGERQTTGYWANIDGVQYKDGTLYVQGIANKPSDRQVTASVLTHPYSAVIVPKVAANDLRREIESTTGWATPTTIVQVPTD